MNSKRIKVQMAETIDHALVQRLSDFVAEVTILLEPLQNQIEILRYWRHYIQEMGFIEITILETYDESIKAREAHLALFQGLLDKGKNTQALVNNSHRSPADQAFILTLNAVIPAEWYRDLQATSGTCEKYGSRNRSANESGEKSSTSKSVDFNIHYHHSYLSPPLFFHVIFR